MFNPIIQANFHKIELSETKELECKEFCLWFINGEFYNIEPPQIYQALG